MIVLFFMLLIIVLVCVIKYAGYVNSTYYKITKKPVLAMRTDVGFALKVYMFLKAKITAVGFSAMKK